MLETMLEHRVTPLTQFTLTPDNLTEAIIVDEKTTKIDETTLEVGLGGTEASSENSIGISSEETSSEEIDEETTTLQMKPIDIDMGGVEEGETKPVEESSEEDEDEEEEEMTTDAITGNLLTFQVIFAQNNSKLFNKILCAKTAQVSHKFVLILYITLFSSLKILKTHFTQKHRQLHQFHKQQLKLHHHHHNRHSMKLCRFLYRMRRQLVH